MDDDIQYLGSRNSNADLVTGITLHLEASTDVPACPLTFSRTNANVIHIGRRPNNDPYTRILEPNGQKALFRCAVVSRKHAKIAFSDSGTVYIIDMGSHHGTHLRKPGETISRILKPETPTQLADGDVLTFGKSVGKNNKCVRPVVARVQLTHVPRPETSFKPITPIKALHIDLTKSPPPRRSNSGRFGVYVPASVSDEDSEEISHDSDIEELPPASGPNALPLKSRNNGSLETSDSHLNHKYEVLRQLFPPVHVPGVPDHEGRRNEVNDSLDQGPNSPASPISPIPSLLTPRYSPYVFHSPTWSIEDFGESSFFGYHVWESRSDSDVASLAPEEEGSGLPSPASLYHSENSRSPDPQCRASRSPLYSPASPCFSENSPVPDLQCRAPVSALHSPVYSPASPCFSENSPIPDPQYRASRSRSTSPMDLASPSPAMAPFQALPREEPITTKAPSPPASTPPPAAEAKSLSSATEGEPVNVEPAASQEPSMAAVKAMSLDAICSSEPLSPAHEYQGEQPSKDETPSEPSVAQITITTDEDVQQAPAPAATIAITTTFAEESEVVALKASLEKLQTDVTKLQSHRRKYRERFNDNFHVLTDRLRSMDERVGDVSAQYSVLFERVDGVAEVDIPELQAQVEALREQVEGLGTKVEVIEGDALKSALEEEKREVRESVEMLRTLVAEMRTLREATFKHMTAELDAFRVARDEALATIAAHVEKQTTTAALPIVPTSLKRKRQDDEDDVDDADAECEGLQDQASLVGGGAAVADVTMADAAAQTSATPPPPQSPPSTSAVSTLADHPLFHSCGTMAESSRSLPLRKRKYKRARRFAAVAVQTATAVTVGAIATWSALAFS